VKRILLLLLSFIPLLVFAKQNESWFSIGIKPGVMYYQGDINKSRLFYAPDFSRGGFAALHFNERYATKISIEKGTAKGAVKDFNNIPQFNPNENFNSPLLDINLQVDFNFLPITPFEIRTKNFSTYVSAGFGMEFLMKDFPKTRFSIPFGIGADYLFGENWGIGIEWNYKKLLYDNLDGKINHTNGSLFLNNDWISVLGIKVYYNILGTPYECHTYDDKSKSKRR